MIKTSNHNEFIGINVKNMTSIKNCSFNGSVVRLKRTGKGSTVENRNEYPTKQVKSLSSFYNIAKEVATR